ncbi:MAG TPA: GGDEF domain-containing protein [Nevskia sp.]|nr:GGDEF domain-containing protein [Nevskia sp.]
MNSFAVELDRLQTVVAAVISQDGTLEKANAGFLRLLPGTPAAAAGQRVATIFVQPSFASLLQTVHRVGDGYRGLLTIGTYAGPLRTLHGHVWKAPDGIRLLAEYGIDELERLNGMVLQLNEELHQAQQELARANIALRQREALIVESSLTDPLTGTGNRRRFDQALAAEISRVKRTGGELSAIMCDLDHFKEINDRHGHMAGDAVLAAFGALLRSQTRPTDCVCRIGGEEFVILLPQSRLDLAEAKAELVRVALMQSSFPGMGQPVTASFGVAQFHSTDTAASFMRRLDATMYEAKRRGRNLVSSAPSS